MEVIQCLFQNDKFYLATLIFYCKKNKYLIFIKLEDIHDR